VNELFLYAFALACHKLTQEHRHRQLPATHGVLKMFHVLYIQSAAVMYERSLQSYTLRILLLRH
jgi:uncharacterized protein (DUF488 family)